MAAGAGSDPEGPHPGGETKSLVLHPTLMHALEPDELAAIADYERRPLRFGPLPRALVAPVPPR